MEVEEEESEVDEAEPQVTSSDPNERKLARQLRIKRRLEALRKKNLPEGEEEEVVEKTVVQEQLKASAKLLEKIIIEADEYVTNVRVGNDSREVDRREDEGIGREKIIEELQEEAEKAREKFDEISEKWANILRYSDPVNINDEMQSQKEKCDELILQKDELIAMLKNELKDLELQFSKDQIKQNDDITVLAHRIEKQVVMMRKAFNNELKLLEDAVATERKMLMDAHNRKWEELYKKRAAEEIFNAEKKFEQREEFEETMRKLSTEFHEKYREVKIELAKETESLECDLEKIKALSLLNNEKLDYNYQILRKREDENLIIKSQQKRRINKLQDVINNLRQKIRDYERDSKEQIEKLTYQVHKVHNDILKIEVKADHFQVSSDERFHHLWDLNKREADRLLERISRADRVIFEQLLGINWVLPEHAAIEKTELPSFKSAMQIVTEMVVRQESRVAQKLSNRLDLRSLRSSPEDAESESIQKSEPEVDSSVQRQQLTPLPHEETVARRRLIRHIFKQVADKTGFLLESNLKEILKPYTEDKSMLVKLDNVFAAIGVKKAEDVSRMVEFFLPYTHCPVCAGEASIEEQESEILMQNLGSQGGSKAGSHPSEGSTVVLNDVGQLIAAVEQPPDVLSAIIASVVDQKTTGLETLVYVEEKEDHHRDAQSATGSKTQPSIDSKEKNASEVFMCQNRHPLVISPVYVMRALKEFVCSLYVDREGTPSIDALLSNKRHNISRLMVEEDITLFWQKYVSTFTPIREKVWDGLYAGLKKYHAILNDRKKVQDEVLELRSENEALNKLLKSYMDKTRTKGSCSGQRVDPLIPALREIGRKL